MSSRSLGGVASIFFASLLSAASSGSAMASAPKRQIIRHQLEHTPSPNDPPDAPEFYRMLGIFIVGWGRLENHFLMCLLDIFGLPEFPAKIAKRIPQTFDRRLEFWNKSFAEIPRMAARRPAAESFESQLSDLAKDRHYVAHAQWGRFKPGIPLSIETSILRNGVAPHMDFGRVDVTLDQIILMAATADHLNMGLYPLSSFLKDLQGAPPEDAEII